MTRRHPNILAQMLVSMLTAMSVFALASPVLADDLPHINTFHYAVGFYDLSDAALDSIAHQYDWIIHADNADYLHAKNPDIRLTLYRDNTFSSTGVAEPLRTFALANGLDPESMYLHFRRDSEQQILGNTGDLKDDKFGARDVLTDNGNGIFIYDAVADTFSHGGYLSLSYSLYDGDDVVFGTHINDALYIGHYDRFKEINITLVSGAAGGFAGVWEYWNGTTWVAIPGVTDGTANFTKSGRVEFVPPTSDQWRRRYVGSESVYIDRWVRYRVTNAGTVRPHLQMIRGQKFIQPGSTSIKWQVPGWDPANDTNGDGVRDANNVPTATADFPWQARVKGTWGWNDKSGWYKKDNPGFLMAFKSHVFNAIAASNADGYYGDDWPWSGLPVEYTNIEGFSNLSSQGEADSIYRWQTVYLEAQAIRDTLVAARIPDTLVGGNTSELVSIKLYYPQGGTNAPMHYQLVEQYNKILIGGWGPSYSPHRLFHWPLVAAARGQDLLLEHYYGSARWDNEKARWDNFALASHYMISGPHIYFGICKTVNPGGLRDMGWIKAAEYDIGQPKIPNNYAALLADTSYRESVHSWFKWKWDTNDKVLAREFDSALVLLRVRDSDGSPTDSSTAHTYTLPGPARRLMSDGTILPTSTQVTLLSSDGAILLGTSFGMLRDTVAPTCALVTPNGGESLIMDSSFNVTWTSSDNVATSDVRLEYSTNSGATWLSMATLSSDPHTYRWTVPATPTVNALVRLTVYDAAGNFDTDSSDATFRIVEPSAFVPPDPIYPADDGLLLATTVTLLAANAQDTAAGRTMFYEFEFGENSALNQGLLVSSPLSTAASGDTAQEWSVPATLQTNKKYYWRTRAIATGTVTDTTAWSRTVSFQVGRYVAAQPKRPKGGGRARESKPTLWADINDSALVTVYYFQIDESPGFENPTESGAITQVGKEASWQVPFELATGHNYYWRAGVNDADSILWSSVAMFVGGPEMHAYPNPFRAAFGHNNMTFAGFQAPARLRVATLAGDMILDTGEITADTYEWNITNQRGDPVASGVYLVRIEDQSGLHDLNVMVIR